MDGNIVESLTEAFLFDVGSLIERFNALTDQRKAKSKRYSLDLVLLLMDLAKLSGEDTPYHHSAAGCPNRPL